jgi:hypothetical protein
MGLEDFFRHYTEIEIDELKSQLRSLRRLQRQKRLSQEQRIAALENGLGRVALLARALAELLLEKGLVTRQELRARLLAVDAADGATDERLDPEVLLPGESKLAELEPLHPPPPARRVRPRRRRR